MSIRLAVPEDAAAVAEVHVESWRAAHATLLPENIVARYRTGTERTEVWTQRFAATGFDGICVAENDGRLVGFAGGGKSRQAADRGELYVLYVHPDAWCQGVGRALQAAVLEQLALEYRRAEVWVLKGNERAIDFYSRTGWERSGQTWRQPFDDFEVELIGFERSLSPG